MIDIFTVLVTFLLMTAVFARITLIHLDVASADNSTPSEPEFRLEVIVRKDGLELTNGRDLIAALPTVTGGYDLETFTEIAFRPEARPSADRQRVRTAGARRRLRLPDSRDGCDPRDGAAGKRC